MMAHPYVKSIYHSGIVPPDSIDKMLRSKTPGEELKVSDRRGQSSLVDVSEPSTVWPFDRDHRALHMFAFLMQW
jgi:hypothetical protein